MRHLDWSPLCDAPRFDGARGSVIGDRQYPDTLPRPKSRQCGAKAQAPLNIESAFRR